MTFSITAREAFTKPKPKKSKLASNLPQIRTLWCNLLHVIMVYNLIN